MTKRSGLLSVVAVATVLTAAGCTSLGGGAGGSGLWPIGGAQPSPMPSPSAPANASPIPNPIPEPRCEPPTPCGQQHWFSMCVAEDGDGCTYLRDDGSERACNCAACPEGVAWCESFGEPEPPPVPLVGCNGYVDCLNDAFANGASSMSVAEGQCDPLAQPDAPSRFQSAVACGQQYCLDQARCTVTGSSLTNLDGSSPTSTSVCGSCLDNALASVFKESCPNTSSVDCNPAVCQSALFACINDFN